MERALYLVGFLHGRDVTGVNERTLSSVKNREWIYPVTAPFREVLRELFKNESKPKSKKSKKKTEEKPKDAPAEQD